MFKKLSALTASLAAVALLATGCATTPAEPVEPVYGPSEPYLLDIWVDDMSKTTNETLASGVRHYLKDPVILSTVLNSIENSHNKIDWALITERGQYLLDEWEAELGEGYQVYFAYMTYKVVQNAGDSAWFVSQDWAPINASGNVIGIEGVFNTECPYASFNKYEADPRFEKNFVEGCVTFLVRKGEVPVGVRKQQPNIDTPQDIYLSVIN